MPNGKKNFATEGTDGTEKGLKAFKSILVSIPPVLFVTYVANKLFRFVRVRVFNINEKRVQ